MTEFDLENLDSGTWFTFCESEINEDGEIVFSDPLEGAGKVCLRQAGFDVIDGIEKECGGKLKREFVLNSETHKMEPVEYKVQTDDEKKRKREMLWDYVIVEWEDLKDKNGNDIPVTLENKMKLILIPVFFRFINRCLETIDGNKEVSEKN
jgi:hypothetical protein